MNIGAELNDKMLPHDLFNINIFGYSIPVADTIVAMWIVMAIIVIGVIFLTRKLNTVPRGKQNVAEIIVEFVNNFTKDNIKHDWKKYAPYFGTIFIFLLVGNIISAFSIFPTSEDLYKITGLGFFEHIPKFELAPPAKDINVTVCMALMSILLVLFSGIRYKKFSGWLKGFAKPMAIMIPFNIMDYFTRPLSLSLRLFGNILAGFTFMELIYLFSPAIVPAFLGIYFDFFDGILQAYIFVFLTAIYISEATE